MSILTIRGRLLAVQTQREGQRPDVGPWAHDALLQTWPEFGLYFGPRLKRMNEGASLRAATKSSRPSPLRSPAAMP